MIRLIQSTWRMRSGIELIILCSAVIGSISSQWIRSMSFNRTWCSVDPPTKVIPLTEFKSYLGARQLSLDRNSQCIPAVAKCSWICGQEMSCTSFNYKAASASCELFDGAILNYESIGTCIHFRSKSSAGNCASLQGTSASAQPDVKVIDAQCCSFPFTYNGNLYHECANRLTAQGNVVDIGCLSVNRTWVSCFLPSDFSVSYKVSNITVPNFTETISIVSINNWIIIQQRLNSSAWLKGSWEDYKRGFAEIEGTFWFGLEKVYQMTNSAPYRLRIEVETLETKTWFSTEYDSFVIDSEAKKYAIHVNGYSGDGGDAFNYQGYSNAMLHNGMAFTTIDSDNDNWGGAYGGNCAVFCGNGGFWYNQCCYVCLTSSTSTKYFFWTIQAADGNLPWLNLDSSRMMMKLA